jgi:hypothetical protein
MTNLRSLNPVLSSAAVLPGHELKFNIPGTSWIEPSWASVEPIGDDESSQNVHGVLYKLAEEDFLSLCQSEGVPFAYTIHRCRVIPYTGNGKTAGEDALRSIAEEIPNGDAQQNIMFNQSIFAYTLRAAQPNWRSSKQDIPPSKSYLNVMIRGALEYGLDEKYVQKLRAVNPGRTMGNGMAELMLEAAEQGSRFKDIFPKRFE